MKIINYLVFFLFACLVSTHLQAQADQEDQSIDGQFKDAMQKSNNYTDSKGKDYEVIRRSRMLTLKANTLDSLKAIQEKLDNVTNQVTTQQKEIATLQTSLAKTDETLSSTREEKDSMSLLGMPMSKIGYNLLMWSIIAGLLGFLLFFIFMFKNSNAAAKAAKSARAHLENEFKEHKRIALEREQKVKRQLQDELNKNRG